MKLNKEVPTLIGLFIIAIATLVMFGGAFVYQAYAMAQLESIIYTQTPVSQDINYKNDEFGFKLVFPETWRNFSVLKQEWNGQEINGDKKYSGVLVLIKNPKTTQQQAYQDIPIMIFTKDIWAKVDGPNATIAVSAAPIGPAKIGENSKYVFATPPRWYGFDDAIGWQEAVEIIKKFKAF